MHYHFIDRKVQRWCFKITHALILLLLCHNYESPMQECSKTIGICFCDKQGGRPLLDPIYKFENAPRPLGSRWATPVLIVCFLLLKKITRY